MATRSTVQGLQSDLSRKLRDKASALREENEKEKQEVAKTEQEYNDTVEQERIRIEEEVMKEMKDRKWSVDREAQEKREVEAKLAEEQAVAEEKRERELKYKWEGMVEGIESKIKKNNNKIKEDFLTFGSKNLLNKELKFPIAWSDTFMRKVMKDVPDEIRSAVSHLFESTSEDRFDFSKASQIAYANGSGKSTSIDERIENLSEKDVPSAEEHKAGLKSVQTFEKFVRKMLASTKEKDLAWDEDGNYRD